MAEKKELMAKQGKKHKKSSKASSEQVASMHQQRHHQQQEQQQSSSSTSYQTSMSSTVHQEQQQQSSLSAEAREWQEKATKERTHVENFATSEASHFGMRVSLHLCVPPCFSVFDCLSFH